MTVAKCPECGIEFNMVNSIHRFCCANHRRAYHARKKYWRDKRNNPDVFEHHRKRGNVNRKDWGERKLAEGLCTRCGKNKLTDNKLCGFCCKELKNRNINHR